jgi:hypothetical protein
MVPPMSPSNSNRRPRSRRDCPDPLAPREALFSEASRASRPTKRRVGAKPAPTDAYGNRQSAPESGEGGPKTGPTSHPAAILGAAIRTMNR